MGYKGAQNSPGLSRNAFTAAEMLAKMCGWNEPEKLSVHSVEVKVDAALIAQLRAGYSELSGPKRVCDARDALCAPVGVGAGGVAPGEGRERT